MKRTRFSLLLTLVMGLALLLAVCAGLVRNDRASAAPKTGGAKHHKVASDLRDQIQRAGQSNAKVILQLNDRMSDQLSALLKGNGVRVKKEFANFNSFAVDLPANVIDSLATFPE